MPRPGGTVTGADRQGPPERGLRPVAARGTSPPSGRAGLSSALHERASDRGPLPAAVEATPRLTYQRSSGRRRLAPERTHVGRYARAVGSRLKRSAGPGELSECSRATEPSDPGAYGRPRVMAVGVEKLKDSGYPGLFRAGPLVSAERRDRARELAHGSGRVQPARLRLLQEVRRRRGAGTVAGRLGVLDCSRVSDGSACADRPRQGRPAVHRPPDLRGGLRDGRGAASGTIDPSHDYTTFPEVARTSFPELCSRRRRGAKAQALR